MRPRRLLADEDDGLDEGDVAEEEGSTGSEFGSEREDEDDEVLDQSFIPRDAPSSDSGKKINILFCFHLSDASSVHPLP